jgi:hypothetical protein
MLSTFAETPPAPPFRADAKQRVLAELAPGAVQDRDDLVERITPEPSASPCYEQPMRRISATRSAPPWVSIISSPLG